MIYSIKFTPTFEKQFTKISKKDKTLFERINKKIDEIIENPEHYKPLKSDMKGYRRVHFDPFIILFSIENDLIIIHSIKHHDEAY